MIVVKGIPMHSSKEVPWSLSTCETVVLVKRRNAYVHPIRAGLVLMKSAGVPRGYEMTIGHGVSGEQERSMTGDRTANRSLVLDWLDARQAPHQLLPENEIRSLERPRGCTGERQ